MKELLDAILAAPDDDALRRVYADALLDDGELLGELIHLQLDLAGHALTREARTARRCRERELLAEHGVRWSAPIAALVPEKSEWGPIVPSATFRRGFVDEVTIDADTFATRGHELFELAPLLRGVTLHGMVEEDAAESVLRTFGAAMRSPLLAHLQGLRCEAGSYWIQGFESRTVERSMVADLMPPFLEAIARMPHLRALAMFDPEDQLQQVIDSGVFTRLDRFDFANFEHDIAMAALDAFSPGRLRNVSLPWRDKPELVAMLGHPRMQDVEELSLKRPILDTALEPLFASLRALPKLWRLELADMRDVPVAPLDLEEISLPEWPTTSVFGWS